jgi:hypothetical protein
MDAQDVELTSPPEGEAPPAPVKVPLSHLTLHSLTPRQVQMIDDALQQVGDFGEVRLVVQRGRLRFVEIVRSLDALKNL